MDGEDERLGKIGTQRLHAVHLCTHVNAFAERWMRSAKTEMLCSVSDSLDATHPLLIQYQADALREIVRVLCYEISDTV